MKIIGPDPNSIYPINDYNKLVFLKNFIKASNIIVGDTLTLGPLKKSSFGSLLDDFVPFRRSLARRITYTAIARDRQTGSKIPKSSLYPVNLHKSSLDYSRYKAN